MQPNKKRKRKERGKPCRVCSFNTSGEMMLRYKGAKLQADKMDTKWAFVNEIRAHTKPVLGKI